MSEKRSFQQGFADADLFGDVPAAGVGARQGRGRPTTGGGGYLKICGVPNFQIAEGPPPDPRFDELEKIGLPGAWLRLARRIGFDAFLDVWRMISDDESTRHDGGRRMPKLREFSAYLRYQRNQYVRSLAASGMDQQQVQKLVQKNLREYLHIRHIQGLMRGRYNRTDI
jgi:hypothetical protein